MSATGLEVFDSTLQKTHIWLNELDELLKLNNKHHAYLALRAVLTNLRDYLSVEEVAQLGAQLPMLIRGFYYEGWRPGKQSQRRSKEDFLSQVYYSLGPAFDKPDLDSQHVVEAVFALLSRHVSEGELEDIRLLLPKAIRSIWQVPA